jgi:hypothetical protein
MAANSRGAGGQAISAVALLPGVAGAYGKLLEPTVMPVGAERHHPPPGVGDPERGVNDAPRRGRRQTARLAS